METIIISILAFLIPGLACYYYNQWRERKRAGKLIEKQIRIRCPKCSSTEIIRTDYFNIDDGLIGNRLFEQYECRNCGNIFTIPVD